MSWRHPPSPSDRKEGQPAIIPHENWRGQFSRGTYTSGAVSDCGPGQTTGCTAIAWPGYRTNAWHARSGSGPDIRTWFGGLVDGMRDASGQMYMRNRYDDPASGQFTQTDPIGLAGGLNAYGFAAGDPVTYSDPYGLKVDCGKANSEACWQWNALREQARDAMKSERADVAQAGRDLWEMISGLEGSEATYQLRMGQRSFIMNWTDKGGYTETTSRVDPEGRPIISTVIDIDYAERRHGVPRLGVLAHEAGHAWAMMQNRSDYTEAGVRSENAWKTLHSCAHRENHTTDIIPRCIY